RFPARPVAAVRADAVRAARAPAVPQSRGSLRARRAARFRRRTARPSVDAGHALRLRRAARLRAAAAPVRPAHLHAAFTTPASRERDVSLQRCPWSVRAPPAGPRRACVDGSAIARRRAEATRASRDLDAPREDCAPRLERGRSTCKALTT